MSSKEKIHAVGVTGLQKQLGNLYMPIPEVSCFFSLASHVELFNCHVIMAFYHVEATCIT